ncbi:hypothetical protein [Nocardia inohanensis]|uniref:hypothetical protein n=1 Tax=Nocardia inohanensis TaxID=209246 RepID=UPI0012F79FF3|nr:hypothetical protein [Nocardia inohanensis]
MDRNAFVEVMNEASGMLDAGRAPEALARLTAFDDGLTAPPDPKEYGWIVSYRFRSAFAAGEFDQALRLAAQGPARFPADIPPATLASMYSMAVEAATQLGRADSAVQMADRCIELRRGHADHGEVLMAAMTACTLLGDIERHDLAGRYARLLVAEGEGYDEYRAYGYYGICAAIEHAADTDLIDLLRAGRDWLTTHDIEFARVALDYLDHAPAIRNAQIAPLTAVDPFAADPLAAPHPAADPAPAAPRAVDPLAAPGFAVDPLGAAPRAVDPLAPPPVTELFAVDPLPSPPRGAGPFAAESGASEGGYAADAFAARPSDVGASPADSVPSGPYAAPGSNPPGVVIPFPGVTPPPPFDPFGGPPSTTPIPGPGPVSPSGAAPFGGPPPGNGPFSSPAVPPPLAGQYAPSPADANATQYLRISGGDADSATPHAQPPAEMVAGGETADALLDAQRPGIAAAAYRALIDDSMASGKPDPLIVGKSVLGLLMSLIFDNRVGEAHEVWIDEQGPTYLGIWALENGQTSVHDGIAYNLVAAFLHSLSTGDRNAANHAVDTLMGRCVDWASGQDPMAVPPMLNTWRRHLREIHEGEPAPEYRWHFEQAAQRWNGPIPEAGLYWMRPYHWHVDWL